jgi:Zn-dependent protease with chaperone function
LFLRREGRIGVNPHAGFKMPEREASAGLRIARARLVFPGERFFEAEPRGFFTKKNQEKADLTVMDFFVIQDRSRLRASGLFTLVFLSACGAIAAVHSLVMLCTGRDFSQWEAHSAVLMWTLPLLVGALLSGVIVRFYAIRLGGGGIAEELGGRRCHPGSEDPSERRVLNIVEDLSVAFGLPVPEVWLLEREPAINAFVVGDEPARAVVGVTRGAVDRLSEEELQAVLAHEFSHVVTGQMRLNFQLLAWVQGLLFFGLVGRMLFRGGEGGRAGGKRATGDRDSSYPLPVIGVLLIFAGSVFSAFGRFLQGALCREQEFVADRASAELLGRREPLLRALRKIGGFSAAGVLRSPAALEAGHLFFCQAAYGIAAAFFPTHPLLGDRIRALEPDWDGEFLRSEARPPGGDGSAGASDGDEEGAESAAPPLSEYAKGLLPVVSGSVFPSTALENLGEVWSWERVEQGRVDRAGLRSDWVQMTLTRDGVKQLIFEICRNMAGVLDSPMARCAPAQKMLLFDLAMPLLRRMSLDEFVSLNRKIRREARKGEDADLLRYLFAHVFARRMQICLGLRETPGVIYEEFSSIWEEAQKLISLMSREGAPSVAARSAAYAAAWKWLGLEMPPLQEQVSMLELGRTLDICAQASPMIKKRLLAACGIAAGYEGQVSEREMVVVRLFADALGTPVPNVRFI